MVITMSAPITTVGVIIIATVLAITIVTARIGTATRCMP